MTRMLEEKIKEMIQKLSLPEAQFTVEPAENPEHGDYATNVAFIVAKQVGRGPREVAEELRNSLGEIENVEKIEIAGPGFINFYLKADYFVDNLKSILEVGDGYGKNEHLKGRKIMVEYTDPNPFKEFHIGHLMPNVIGESITRLIKFSGAKVVRANYQGDVGLHVAKAIWGKLQKNDLPFGQAYTYGNEQYETDEDAKAEIIVLNKKIYARTDEEINNLYDKGRKQSLDGFEKIYDTLGTKFDRYYFESEMSESGTKLVRDNVPAIFEESDGALVFKAEKHDPALHTRVFINKESLPTYEAKELALAKRKFEDENLDLSVVVTGNEIKDYYRVVMKALSLIKEEWSAKTLHITHGMLRFASGKMSSRKGNVITGESLIADVGKLVKEKMSESPVPEGERTKVATDVAVGAIKFSILRQAIGKDIIYDFEKSISFEGDSGPYLQYTHARIKSVLAKAESEHLAPGVSSEVSVGKIEKKLEQFPQIASRAVSEYAPQYIVTYLLELASLFNAYYAQNKIIDPEQNEISEYRLALAQATAQVLKNGLWLLGIKAPEKM